MCKATVGANWRAESRRCTSLSTSSSANTRRSTVPRSTASCLNRRITCPARSRLWSTMSSPVRCLSSTARNCAGVRRPSSAWCRASSSRRAIVEAVTLALPSGVFSSCATPATSSPSEASFSACTSSACRWRRRSSEASDSALAVASARWLVCRSASRCSRSRSIWRRRQVAPPASSSTRALAPPLCQALVLRRWLTLAPGTSATKYQVAVASRPGPGSVGRKSWKCHMPSAPSRRPRPCSCMSCHSAGSEWGSPGRVDRASTRRPSGP